MSMLDTSQYTKHNLVRVSSGEAVGVAFIRKGEAIEGLGHLKAVEVDEENNALASSGYISLPGETREQIVKQEPEEVEGDANISSIFVEDSSDDDFNHESTSRSKATKCSSDLVSKIKVEESPEVLVSDIAAQMLRSLGSCHVEGDKGTELTQVRVKKEALGQKGLKGSLLIDSRLERELEAAGLMEGKKDLDKPGEFGWLRETVTHHARGHVTSTNYITPPHPVTKARRRVKTRREIMKYLESSGNKELSFRNFNLSNRFLGLKPGFEVVRTSMSTGKNDEVPQKRARFAEYFKWLPHDSSGSLLDPGARKVRDAIPGLLAGVEVTFNDFTNVLKVSDRDSLKRPTWDQFICNLTHNVKMQLGHHTLVIIQASLVRKI